MGSIPTYSRQTESPAAIEVAGLSFVFMQVCGLLKAKNMLTYLSKNYIKITYFYPKIQHEIQHGLSPYIYSRKPKIKKAGPPPPFCLCLLSALPRRIAQIRTQYALRKSSSNSRHNHSFMDLPLVILLIFNIAF